MTIGLRLARLFLAVVSRLVPRDDRDQWLAEWEGELTARWLEWPPDRAGRWVLYRRLPGALRHALWYRLQDWKGEIVNRDFRYALRVLRKQPVPSLVVILTIALGIGANAAIFAVVNGVLLEPLPYDDPDRLVMVWERNFPRERIINPVSGANYMAWQEDARSFSGFGSIAAVSSTVTGDGPPERVGTVLVNASFLDLVGAQPVLGRRFSTEEDVDGGPDVAMISAGYWRRVYGGDRNVIGQSIIVSNTPREIVGVLPDGFHFDLEWTFNFTGEQDIWLPHQFSDDIYTQRGRWLQVLARLAPGVTLAQAQEEMTRLASRYEEEFPNAQTGWGVNVVPLHQQVVGEVSSALWIILGAVSCVFLIAVANVANILLTRASAREHQMAVRMALGANRTRIIRQLLLESTTLALVGGLLGIVLARLAVTGLLALAPDIPRLAGITLDVRVLVFGLLLSLAGGTLFGAIPALRSANVSVSGALREGGIRAGSGRGVIRMRSGLVVFEFALSLILLVGAGLLIRSFGRMAERGIGLDADNLITAQIQLPSDRFSTLPEFVQFYQAAADRVEAAPGVSAASAITFLPLAGAGSATSFWLNDREQPEEGEEPSADLRWVLGDYFQTMRIPMIEGRTFDNRDTEDGQLAVIINEYMADQYWPNESPLGRTLSMPWGDTLVAEIIGVVGNVRHDGPASDSREKLYWSPQQFASFGQMTIVARTDGDPLEHAATIRSAVLELQPGLPIYNVRTMGSYLVDATGQTRFAMLALTLFGGVAVILAAIGIYGVMSYTVSQRTQEIGVRIALGAGEDRVAMMVVRSGLGMIGLALVIGAAGYLALARILESMVFEVGTRDPLTLALVAAALAAVAVFASYVPARRASRVDPVRALKQE